MYLVSAGRRTFRPWTHTSDDSYMYQLSLVVATATVSFQGIDSLVFTYEAHDTRSFALGTHGVPYLTHFPFSVVRIS